MKKTITYTYCDICGRQIPGAACHPEVIFESASFPLQTQALFSGKDLCSSCHEKLYVNVKEALDEFQKGEKNDKARND